MAASSKYSDGQLKWMRQQFLQLDLRGDAKIGRYHLGDCLRILGMNPAEATIRQHLQRLRASQIERITFDEFMFIYDSIAPETTGNDNADTVNEFLATFRYFDHNNTGYMPVARLRQILNSCGERLTDNELDELLLNRVNDQGLVNYVEFVNAITAAPISFTQMQ